MGELRSPAPSCLLSQLFERSVLALKGWDQGRGLVDVVSQCADGLTAET